ncbi:MAG TPA: helix-turn-helix domain-containing protein [bacterium]|nr:helix-turn-helix domain-containing protein [bacterium]
MKTKPQRSHCPISFALETFGDRWSLLILRDIIFRRKKHYREFLNSGEKVSTNILADRLAKLEVEGLIAKADDPLNGKQVVYSPTKKALDLVPMMLEMIQWSVKHDPSTDAPKDLMRRLKKNPNKLKKEILFQFDEGQV